LNAYIVIKLNFVTQNLILCVIGYEISKEFIPPTAVLNTTVGGSKKLTLLIFLGGPFEILKTI
jgi:hypothetical protein